MTNPYYNHGSFPATSSAGTSAAMRAELDLITQGFNKLPTLTANNMVFVNSSGTGLEPRSGIDGIVIGNVTPAAGTFTDLTANGNTLLGNASTDTLNVGSGGIIKDASGNTGFGAVSIGNKVYILKSSDFATESSAGLYIASGSGAGTAGIQFGADPFIGAGYIQALEPSVSFTSKPLVLQRNGGNVGIGVSPLVRLHAKSTVEIVRLETTTARGSGNGYLSFYDPTGLKGYLGYASGANDNMFLWNALNAAFEIATNNTQRVVVGAAGNVSINGVGSGNVLSLTQAVATMALSIASPNGVNNGIALAQSAVVGWDIYNPASSVQLRLRYNGTDGYYFNTSNQMGIGVTPLNTLHIQSASGSTIMRFSDSTPQTLGYIGSGNGLLGGAAAATDFAIRAETNLFLSSNAGTAQAKIDTSGNFVVIGAGGLGYGTGSGGSITQTTSKSTSVTLNKTNGLITMNAASLAAGTGVTFTVINNTVAATDFVGIAFRSSVANTGSYTAHVVNTTGGAFDVMLVNRSGGALAEAVQLTFSVFRAVNA